MQRILTNLALLPAEVLQKAESRIRDRGKRKKAENIDKPCPAPCRGPAEGRKQNKRRREKKQRILTNLALLSAEVLQKAKAESETEETESREY